MLEVDKKREATASIRGYFYQLDAALLEILNAGLDENVVIEGIEDFDRYTDEGVIYGQVKYYAEQNLTDSVLRDPLHKLFVHFHGLEEAQRAGRKYLLYGHFSEVKIDIGELSVERFKSVMEYRKEVKAADGTKSYEKKSLLDGMAAPELFCTWLNREAVLTFASEHRIAREFLPWFGDNLYRFTSYMGNAGYAPILRPRSKAEGSVNAIYRLADVMTKFHLERDPTRFRDPQLDEVWQQLRQLGGRLPPYLQFPRELPVVGQLVANPKGTVAFQLTYDPAKRVITMEGKRQAAAVSLTVSVSNNVELKREEVETAFKSLC